MPQAGALAKRESIYTNPVRQVQGSSSKHGKRGPIYLHGANPSNRYARQLLIQQHQVVGGPHSSCSGHGLPDGSGSCPPGGTSGGHYKRTAGTAAWLCTYADSP